MYIYIYIYSGPNRNENKNRSRSRNMRICEYANYMTLDKSMETEMELHVVSFYKSGSDYLLLGLVPLFL